jgi:hypothetical protein
VVSILSRDQAIFPSGFSLASPSLIDRRAGIERVTVTKRELIKSGGSFSAREADIQSQCGFHLERDIQRR